MTRACDASTPYYTDFVTVTEALRCPVCDGQRIASSDAPFALTVKRDVCAALQEGLNAAHTIARIEAAYGSDLHVENGTSPMMLPLLAVMGVFLVLGIMRVRKLVTH
jgi:cytochrome c-type biogenesis protein CcmH/NrfF